ncbi:MAG: hypothetical protein PWP65_1966 [Clostridia bacterium]|nr:hypothetical protein [Clostridia bacterium]
MVEGSLLAALAAVLALAGFYAPPLRFFTHMVWTVPLVVAVVRLDLRTGVMATVVAGALVAFFAGPVPAFLLFLQFAALGLTYGYLFKIKAAPGRILLYGTFVALLSMAVTLALSFWLVGLPLAGLGQELDAALENTMELYRRAGFLKALEAQGVTAEQLRQTLAAYIYWIKMLLPGILGAASLLNALANFLVAQAVLVRLKLHSGNLPPFRYWQLPWYFIWGFIAGLALWLAGDVAQQRWAVVAGLNILYLYLPLLAGNGLAAATFLYHRLNWPPLSKALIILALATSLPAAAILLLALGLFDPFLGYRRFEPPRGREGED